MHTSTVPRPGFPRRSAPSSRHTLPLWLAEHWLAIFLVLLGLFWALPFLAPLFMRVGWLEPARLIYNLYSTQCHQMAQRSFFLFGPQPMYNLAQLPIPQVGDEVSLLLASRTFIGNTDLGWKVAWSDRMVYMYGGILLAGLAFTFLHSRRGIRPLRLSMLALFLLPMILDGASHWWSDVTGGLAGGFRYSNQWPANLTGSQFPNWFYVGDALGSFNSWLRLASGLLFGVGVVWFLLPHLEKSMSELLLMLREELARPEVRPNGV